MQYLLFYCCHFTGGGNGIVTTVVLLEFVVVTGGCKGFNKKVAVADAVFRTAPSVDGATTITWNVTVNDVPAAILGSGKPIFGSNPVEAFHLSLHYLLQMLFLEQSCQ